MLLLRCRVEIVMMTLFILLALSLLLGIFAIQNNAGVMLQYGGYIVKGVPLYAVVIGSMLIGIALSWILSLFGWASTAMQLSGKDKSIKHYSQTAQSLEAKVHDLELENERLRGEKKEVKVVHEREVEPADRPFLERVRSSFS